MKIRKTKIENADTTAMVKPGKPGLSNTPLCGAKIVNGLTAMLRCYRNRSSRERSMTESIPLG